MQRFDIVPQKVAPAVASRRSRCCCALMKIHTRVGSTCRICRLHGRKTNFELLGRPVPIEQASAVPKATQAVIDVLGRVRANFEGRFGPSCRCPGARKRRVLSQEEDDGRSGIGLGRVSRHSRCLKTLIRGIRSRPESQRTNRLKTMLAASGAATNATGTRNKKPLCRHGAWCQAVTEDRWPPPTNKRQ